MSTVAVAASCSCGSIGRTDLRQCSEHHRYWRGDFELASVSKVLRSTWPIPPDFSKADPAVIENARDRGTVVDSLFSAYVNGTLTKIPAGTRMDAVELFQKLRLWLDAKGRPAKAQVMLAFEDVAGTCDLLTSNHNGEPCIFDVKATYNVERTYELQLGAYAYLYQSMHGIAPKIGIVHVTARFPEPKIIYLDEWTCAADWLKLLDMWRMVQRRTA